MTTTNLIVTSANYNPTTAEMTCLVTATSPLYIYELCIESVNGQGSAQGLIRPGSSQHPASRTIFVDSTDPVFTTAAPFTLSVTYNGAYQLSDAHVVQTMGIARTDDAPQYDPLANLSPEQASLFVTRVLEAAVALFKSPARATPSEAMASAYNEAARARGNGHDRHA